MEKQKRSIEDQFLDTGFSNLSQLEGLHPDTIYMYASYALGKVYYVSPSVYQVLGYSQEELVKGGIEFWPQHSHPDDLPTMLEIHKNLFAQTQESTFDARRLNSLNFRHRLKNGWGEWVSLDYSGLILSFNSLNEPDKTFITMRVQEFVEGNPGVEVPEKMIIEDSPLLKAPLRQDMIQDISPREKEVLMLIANGNSARKISKELNISTHTVISHRKKLIEKFGVKNTAQLIKEASKTFWLD